jgi:hypothetical protein
MMAANDEHAQWDACDVVARRLTRSGYELYGL